MTEVLIEIVVIIIRVVFAVLFAWTGEILIFLFTFGKHKPQWGLYGEKSPARFVISSHVSMWIGIAFWLLLAAFLYWNY
jgi:hypothetical protein